MKSRISLLTIGVNDLEESMRFYKGLGLETDRIIGKEFEQGVAVLFNLKGGLILALNPRNDIAWDAKFPKGRRERPNLQFGSKHKEVNLVMREAERPGAKVIKPPQNAFQ